MSAGVFCDLEHPVDSREVDLFGQMRMSALLGVLQEAAAAAMTELEMDAPRLMAKYHAIWIVNRYHVKLTRPLYWGDRLTVRTWHRGGGSGSVYREFALYLDGAAVGSAVSLWVMVDPDSHKVVPARGCPELQGTDGGALCGRERLHRLELPGTFDGRALRELRYSETDMNGHINNTHYADFLCDALHLERLGRGKYPADFHICFLEECLAGETIALDTALREDTLYARGTGPDGRERFQCSMTLATLPAQE